MPASFDDHPGVIETRIVHDVHRRATSLLTDAVGAPSAPIRLVAELRDFVVATLHHHHACEDSDLWPLLGSAAPDLTRDLWTLTEEHERLQHQLDTLQRIPIDHEADRARCIEPAGELRDLVHEHLAHEEPLLFPALRRNVSLRAWSEFSARTVASSPPEGTHLLVAMLHEAGTNDELDIIFRHLPPPARDLLPAKLADGRAALAMIEPLRAAVGLRRTPGSRTP
jgi:hemerythrin-like domain-containing protein